VTSGGNNFNDFPENQLTKTTDKNDKKQFFGKKQKNKPRKTSATIQRLFNPTNTIVGFVAAAVSMPIGGCRARRRCLVVVVVDVSVATGLTVL